MEESLTHCLATLLIAMLPIVELRGAIPFGLAAGLPYETAFLLGLIGNMIPVPFILLFIRKILQFLRRSARFGPLICSIETRAHLKGRIVTRYKTLGLCILVAIPLPGTGAWTGALVASLLDIPIRKALPTIFLGVFIAGCIITLISYSAILTFGG